MSAADYSWGAGDVLGKLRAAEAALSRVKALADGWARDVATLRVDAIRDADLEADWHASARQQHLDMLRVALGGAA